MNLIPWAFIQQKNQLINSGIVPEKHFSEFLEITSQIAWLDSSILQNLLITPAKNKSFKIQETSRDKIKLKVLARNKKRKLKRNTIANCLRREL